MKKEVIIISLVVLAIVGFTTYKFWPHQNSQVKGLKISQIKIGSQTIKAEVADTQELRNKGLSGRESLCTDCGMVFIFESPGLYSFWMNEMNFDLDIIWLNDNKIVDIWPNAPAPKNNNGQIASYMSKAMVDKVIELNAGFCAKNKVKIGDEVK